MPNQAPWFGPSRRSLNVWRDLIDTAFEQPFGFASCIKSDAYETRTEWVYIMEIPGLSRDHELDVRVQGQSLCINGESRDRQEGGAGTALSEMSFSYVVPLGEGLQIDKVTTQLDGQVLTVRIPKK